MNNKNPTKTARRVRGLIRTCAAVVALLLLGIVELSSSPAYGQPLITDRPDFTESAVVVPEDSFQIEGGFTWTDGGEIEEVTAPELLVRWGVTEKVEVRFELPNLIDPSEGGSGVGDAAVGAKIQVGPLSTGWDFAVIGMLSVPTGDPEFTSDEVDPSVILTVGTDLTERVSIGLQAGVELPTVEDERITVLSATSVLGMPLGERTGTFVELAAEKVEDFDAGVLLHHGYTYAVNPTLQWDIHAGVGLTDEAPDVLVGLGASWRW